MFCGGVSMPECTRKQLSLELMLIITTRSLAIFHPIPFLNPRSHQHSYTSSWKERIFFLSQEKKEIGRKWVLKCCSLSKCNIIQISGINEDEHVINTQEENKRIQGWTKFHQQKHFIKEDKEENMFVHAWAVDQVWLYKKHLNEWENEVDKSDIDDCSVVICLVACIN